MKPADALLLRAVEYQRFQLWRHHAVVTTADGPSSCWCGWTLPELGFDWTMAYVLEHYERLS